MRKYYVIRNEFNEKHYPTLMGQYLDMAPGYANVIEYDETNGTYYHAETPDEVVKVLELCRAKHIRIKFDYGDRRTGKSWNEAYDVTGYISRSMGPIKVPILLNNIQSNGGGSILDHCIIAIRYDNEKHGGYLYKHDKYEGAL